MHWTLVVFLWLSGQPPQDVCTTLPQKYVQQLHVAPPAGKTGVLCVNPRDLKLLDRGYKPTYKTVYLRY